MYRQMMKRKHPSSSPLLEEEEAKRMADSVALELERGIRLSPKKKRARTTPLHDPFFVGTPEEEALHMQRLEGRKRKSEDFSAGDETHQPPGPAAAPADGRGCKIARRSREQMSAVDIDTLNRQLSTVDLSDTSDTNANPCRALALYSPDPFAHPTITSTDDLLDLNDDPSGPEASLLSRYRNRFPFRVEDLSKALIIYPEEHPLQPVIDKIKDYERRTGRSNVRIEELTSSSLDDIDDDHSTRMIEEQNGYLVDEDSEEEEQALDLEDNEEDNEYGGHGEVEDGLVKETYPSIPAEERFERLHAHAIDYNLNAVFVALLWVYHIILFSFHFNFQHHYHHSVFIILLLLYILFVASFSSLLGFSNFFWGHVYLSPFFSVW